MKLHFESNLEYQTHAVEAVCHLFRGQEICRTEFTVTRDALGPQQALAFHESDLGIGKRPACAQGARDAERRGDAAGPG